MAEPRGRSEHLYPDERGEWTVGLEWAEVDGRVECVGVTVRHVEGAKPVTASLLRSIPFGRFVADKRRQRHGTLLRLATGYAGQRSEALAERQLDEYAAGKPRYGEDHWRDVAEVYREAHRSGEAPTRAVAEVFGVSRTAAGKWVARCREAGLLGRTEQRKAGEDDKE